MVLNFIQFLTGMQNIDRVQGDATKFILIYVDTSVSVFEELLGKNSLLNIQEYNVAGAKCQGNNDFELSIDELKAVLGYV